MLILTKILIGLTTVLACHSAYVEGQPLDSYRSAVEKGFISVILDIVRSLIGSILEKIKALISNLIVTAMRLLKKILPTLIYELFPQELKKLTENDYSNYAPSHLYPNSDFAYPVVQFEPLNVGTLDTNYDDNLY